MVTQSPRRRSLFDLTFDSLRRQLDEWGQPSYRTAQIFDWIYRKQVSAIIEMKNLPGPLRDQLLAEFDLWRATIAVDRQSSDGWTRKILFQLPNQAWVETVRMEYPAPASSTLNRNTLCVSSQAGCAMGCSFCATGQDGFVRNLMPGEIVEQVLFFVRELAKAKNRVSNIVFMGMGEPFANYPNVMRAIRILTDPKGLGMSARRLTISTVGLIPGIRKFMQEDTLANLAISLHATDPGLRSRLIPMNDRYPVEDLLAVCHDYTMQTGKRITFEWALIQEVNDSPADARALASLLKGMSCFVNLIPLNPTAGYTGHQSAQNRVQTFQEILDQNRIPNHVRVRRGIDIEAGCGQLKRSLVSP